MRNSRPSVKNFEFRISHPHPQRTGWVTGNSKLRTQNSPERVGGIPNSSFLIILGGVFPDQRDGSVVDQFNVHQGTEDPGFNRHTLFAQ